VQYLASAARAASSKITQVSHQAAITGASAEQLSQSAANLLDNSGRLESEVGTFLAGVRAA
jgi:methyl-accepting chemotaxis protein